MKRPSLFVPTTNEMITFVISSSDFDKPLKQQDVQAAFKPISLISPYNNNFVYLFGNSYQKTLENVYVISTLVQNKLFSKIIKQGM